MLLSASPWVCLYGTMICMSIKNKYPNGFPYHGWAPSKCVTLCLACILTPTQRSGEVYIYSCGERFD